METEKSRKLQQKYQKAVGKENNNKKKQKKTKHE